MTVSPEALDAGLTPREVAALIGVTVGALANWRVSGRGPTYIRISGRCVRYWRSDVMRFLAERTCRSTSDHRAARTGT